MNGQPWTAEPGSKPCLADAPEALKLQHGRPLVCTRPKGHDGDHVVGPGLVRWITEDVVTG